MTVYVFDYNNELVHIYHTNHRETTSVLFSLSYLICIYNHERSKSLAAFIRCMIDRWNHATQHHSLALRVDTPAHPFHVHIHILALIRVPVKGAAGWIDKGVDLRIICAEAEVLDLPGQEQHQQEGGGRRKHLAVTVSASMYTDRVVCMVCKNTS